MVALETEADDTENLCNALQSLPGALGRVKKAITQRL